MGTEGPSQRRDPLLLPLQEAMSAEDHEVRAGAEDGSSGGSGSPSPGDTLPWNLEKTQRSRRSGGGSGGNGSVLDPAERAVIRIAGNARGPHRSVCERRPVRGASAVCCLRVRDGDERAAPVPGGGRRHSATCWPRPARSVRPD